MPDPSGGEVRGCGRLEPCCGRLGAVTGSGWWPRRRMRDRRDGAPSCGPVVSPGPAFLPLDSRGRGRCLMSPVL